MRQRNSRLYALNIQRRLRIEALETRRVMAGNVTAEVIDGDLIITGDDEANTISVRGDDGAIVVESDGGFRLFAIDAPSSGVGRLNNPTQVNGEFRDARFESVTGDIVINAGGGDDRMVIRNVIDNGFSVSASSFSAPGDLIIDGGAGYDQIEVGEEIQPTEFTIVPGGQAVPVEPVPVPELAIAGNLQINTGEEGSSVIVRPGTVGGALDVVASSAEGENTNSIRLFGVTATSYSIVGSDSIENVFLSSLSTVGAFTVAAGSGADNIEIYALDVGGDSSIELGEGTDQVTIEGTVRGNFDVRGDAGNDSLILGGENRSEHIRLHGEPHDPLRRMELGAGGPLFVAGQMSVQTGGGDFLNLQHARIVGDLRIDSGVAHSPEFIRLKSVSARGLVVLTKAGDDIVNVAFATAEKQLAVHLGDGNDVLSMYVVAYNNHETRDDDLLIAASFLGEEGRDTLAFDGCRFEGVASFEGGNGDDHLLLTRSLVNHHASIWMDGGRDRVEIAFSAISSLSPSTGADDDHVSVRTCAVDRASFHLGEGADLLDIDGCVLRAISDANGEAGFDTLNRRNSRIKQFNATNFEAGSDLGLVFV